VYKLAQVKSDAVVVLSSHLSLLCSARERVVLNYIVYLHSTSRFLLYNILRAFFAYAMYTQRSTT
jgi:hypothetical protein